MQMLKGIVGILALLGVHNLHAADGGGSMPLINALTFAETGASYKPQFTCTDTGQLTCTTTIVTAGTNFTAPTNLEGNYRFDLLSNDHDGFTITMVSTEDGNMRHQDVSTGGCDNVNGDHATLDASCISYEIACDLIVHDDTGDGDIEQTVFKVGGTAGSDTASTYGRLTDVAQTVYDARLNTNGRVNVSGGTASASTETDQRGNIVAGEAGDFDCLIRFAENEKKEEIVDGTYTDTITVTLISGDGS